MPKFTVLLLLAVLVPAPVGGQAQQVVRASEGFVLAIPSGWREAADLGGSAGLTKADGSEVFVSVQIRQESEGVLVSDVLSRFVGRMRADGSVTVLSSRFGTFLNRRAAFAEIEDDGSRFKLILIPRDTGDTSLHYFVLTGWTAVARFAAAQSELDRVFAGFEVTAPTASPVAPAPTRSRFDLEARSAFFDHVLAPREGPEGVTPAAEAHRRGLEFARQGAWREAESAFHDAERKNDKVPEYKLSAAFAYLKTHKPNDAYKRYEDFYKKDPANTRALTGMIAAREEAQRYRDAVTLWMRYVRLPHQGEAATEAQALLNGARELFAARYEIAENPAGGAENLASPAQELAWGLEYAKGLSDSGQPLLTDPEVVAYIEQLCQGLVDKAKQFPTNYQLFVLDTASVNATTAPGFIFVYRGLLDAVQSEAALAGILAHEIGHSVAHHGAKQMTKAYQDQKQLERFKASNSKLSQFLVKMLEAGNPVGAMTFSRESEEQADRLGVHIAFDAGFDPLGLTEMFQQLEQMSPSSRNSWDLMYRTHPFSIDRINAVREYAALLPARAPVQASTAFSRMKTRLSALPPAPDATGVMKPTAPPAAPPAPPPSTTTPAGRISFSIEWPPYVGEMPEGWRARRTEDAVLIEGVPETEPYEMTIRLSFRDKTATSLDALAGEFRAAFASLPEAAVSTSDVQKTQEGRPLRVHAVSYAGQNSAKTSMPFRQLVAVVEYPDHLVAVQYLGPASLFDKYLAAFDMVGSTLRAR